MLPARFLRSCTRFPSATVTSRYSGSQNMEKPVETSIRAKLSQNLEPCHLEVHNESYMHAVPAESETHFKVVVVSDAFRGKSLIQRHRLVNDLLKDELAGPVHALSIQAKTPQQWEENPTINESPGCMGGSKHDPQMGKKLSSQV
ncbi:bolA-like protein 1 [Anomaloglossus baeobatrachus]|uniref:bolA-like protein 1 n=1 Tax=Anomaloglossus baeobatrachus TaxID=238106 RepID=UPI003F50BE1A